MGSRVYFYVGFGGEGKTSADWFWKNDFEIQKDLWKSQIEESGTPEEGSLTVKFIGMVQNMTQERHAWLNVCKYTHQMAFIEYGGFHNIIYG